MTDQDKHLRVVDAATRIVDAGTNAELALLDMEVRRKARACSDCRFNLERFDNANRLKNYCGAYNKWCANANTNADCELWEPNAAYRRSLPVSAEPPNAVVRSAMSVSYVAIALSVFSVVLVLVERCS